MYICTHIHTHIFIYFGEGNDNHSSIRALEIPWPEEPSGLQSRGLQKLDMTEQLNHHLFFLEDYNKTNINTNLIQILFNPFHFVFHLCLLHLSAFCYVIRKEKKTRGNILTS